MKDLILGLVLLIHLSGCALKWEPALQDAYESSPTSHSRELLAKAELNFNHAKDKKSLEKTIESYLRVLDINQGDYKALVALSTQHILMGTAYIESPFEKSHYYHQAMRYAELAMYKNNEFKKLIESGETLWGAAHVLGEGEVEAMLFWATAIQYEFKEGMTLPGKIRNVDWLSYSLIFLNRIEEVAPEFGGGAVEFGKVISYYVLPESKGGDKQKGDEYMQKAITKGEKWLLPRWARGKYYYKIKKEDEKSRLDLMWVANQDLQKFDDPFPWRVHFMEDAKKMSY